jgi:hypothetical protein
MQPEGIAVARYTVERLILHLGLRRDEKLEGGG